LELRPRHSRLQKQIGIHAALGKGAAHSHPQGETGSREHAEFFKRFVESFFPSKERYFQEGKGRHRSPIRESGLPIGYVLYFVDESP
jgi:hypothetical protein